jgi:dUTP pyrophosphatase
LRIKVLRLHPDAKLPEQRYNTDSGYDLTAIDDGVESPEGYIVYRTGIAVQPPEGYAFQVRPRSSIRKYDLILCNSPGTIDNGFTGELLVNFKPIKNNRSFYKKGDKIAQLVLEKIYPMEFVEVSQLDLTDRKDCGFGSTGS